MDLLIGRVFCPQKCWCPAAYLCCGIQQPIRCHLLLICHGILLLIETAKRTEGLFNLVFPTRTRIKHSFQRNVFIHSNHMVEPAEPLIINTLSNVHTPPDRDGRLAKRLQCEYRYDSIPFFSFSIPIFNNITTSSSELFFRMKIFDRHKTKI